MRQDTHPPVGGAGIASTPPFEAPLVGRARELDRLIATLDDTIRTGQPRFVVIEGAPGIGKSRLTRELVSYARDAQPAGTILLGRCLSGGPGVSNWAPAEMLRRAFGIGSDATPSELGARFSSGVARALEPLALPAREQERTAQALAASAGILVPGNPYDRAEPRDVEAAIVRAWSRLFEGYARRGNTLVVLEDIHWAGAALRTILARVAPALSGPVLHVVTTRPGLREERPGFLDGPDIEWLSLRSLSEADSRSLVTSLLAASDPTAEALAAIATRAEGNPYFIEEAVRHMVESGALRQEPEGWVLRAPRGSSTIPDSLSSVLTLRLESLPLGERQVLQEASVVGRTFWEGTLRHVLGDAGLRTTLRHLSERGLIVPESVSSLPGQDQWSFRHLLLRDAAYSTLSAQRRARSHAAVGAWLASLPPALADETAEMIATHYRLAVELDDGSARDPAEHDVTRATAIRYLLHAGDRARQRSAIDRAVELHDAALRIAATEPDRARALAGLAQDHEYGLAGASALEAYRGARAAASRAGLPDDERARICLGMGRLLALRWGGFPVPQDPAELDEVADEGLRLADDPDSRAWLRAVKAAGGLRWSGWAGTDPLGIDERIAAAEASMDYATRNGTANLEGILLNIRGYLLHGAGRFDEALATLRRLGSEAEQIESPYLRGLTSMWVALGFTDLAGDYLGAMVHARRSLDIGRSRTAHERLHGTWSAMWCAYHLGDWSLVHDLTDEHFAALGTLGPACCPYLRAGPMLGALALAHGGDLDRALDLAGQIEADTTHPALPEALLARVLVATGDPAAGARLARSMIDGGRRPSLEQNDHETHALIEALVALKDWVALAEFLPPARSRVRGLVILGPVCDRAEAMAMVANGAPDRAVPLLRRAAAWFERARVPFELARTRTILAPLVPEGDRLMAEAIEAAGSILGASTAGVAGPVVEPPAPATDDLSAREREILARVAQGRDNAQIASELVLSLRTVERHVSNIYLKLGLEGRTSRAAAVSWAHRHGVAGPG